MLDEPHQSDGARLFMNTATGRFVRRDLRPVLRRYFLVLDGRRSSPHAACLLNPFTGSFVQFAALVPPELKFIKVAAHVIGCSSPTLILVRACGGDGNTTRYWAGPIPTAEVSTC